MKWYDILHWHFHKTICIRFPRLKLRKRLQWIPFIRNLKFYWD